MKICIVAYYFPPNPAVGSIRPENWAQWLAKDNDVTVVTQHTLHHIDKNIPYKIIRKKSLCIFYLEMLNLWRKKNATKVISSKKNKKTTGIFFYRMPCLHDLWFYTCYRSISQVQPDIIIATHNPYISLLAAWIYKKRHKKVKLWVDFRDFWSESVNMSGLPIINKIEKLLEKKVTYDSNVITTVSEAFTDIFKKHVLPEKVKLIYNSHSLSSFSEKSLNNHKKDDKSIIISYTGILCNASRDPSPLLEFLGSKEYKKMGDNMLRFKVASQNPHNFIYLVKKFNVTNSVEFLGKITRKQSINLQESSDILLLLGSSTKDSQGELTAKIFEYLKTDKPILLIGPNKNSEIYQLLSQHDRLLSLEQLKLIIDKKKKLPICKPVDYSNIARQQLIDVLKYVSTKD